MTDDISTLIARLLQQDYPTNRSKYLIVRITRMPEITIIYCYITKKVKFDLINNTFGYSQKLILNTKLTYYW